MMWLKFSLVTKDRVYLKRLSGGVKFVSSKRACAVDRWCFDKPALIHYFWQVHIEEFREYCLAKPGVEETFPFDDTTLVYKVMGKMFAATGLGEEELRVNLKCDPDRALELREEYHQIIPGYHMSKKHWNTVYFEQGLERSFLCEMIDHSYALVVAKLPINAQNALKDLA